MRRLLALVALATVFASACGGSPTTPSEGSDKSVVVTSIPPAGATLTEGQRYEISVSVPSATGAGMTALVGFVFIRDDGAQYLGGCGSANSGGSGTVGPADGISVWAKDHMVNLEILVADVPISEVVGRRCLFAPADPSDVHRERATRTPFHKELNWRF